MKKQFSLFAAAVFFCSGLLLADVFASRMQVTNPNGSPFDGKVNDGSGAKIWYYLNDTAMSVSVKVIHAGTNAVVATINATNQGRSTNPNSVTWDGTGSAPNTHYYYTITATGKVYSTTNHTWFYFQNTADVAPISRGIYTRGVEVNKNMNSKGFGYWYASNSDPGNNDGYKQGTLRYNPDGTFAGTEAGHPLLMNTFGVANGGTFDWGGTAPWSTAVDAKGRIYQVSNGGSFVTRLDHDSAAPKIIIRNISQPRGLYTVGSGADLKIYIAADTMVWRADIGNNDTLSTALVPVLSLGTYVRDVILDDAGAMYVTLRTGTAGTAPGYVERYDISGTLPKKRVDAAFSITHSTGQPVCLALWSGPDKNSASDDTLYYSIRGATGSDTLNLGIHMVTGIDGLFPDAKRIFKSGDVPGSIGGNNNANADLALDWAGNLIWFENSNEEIFMVAPPRSGTSTVQTTRSADSISISGSTSVGDGRTAPESFVVNQNYPNPFNPSTVISYTLPAPARVSVTVYDVLGNVVSEIFNGTGNAGYNAVVWNATAAAGTRVASGMYLYRVAVQLENGTAFSDTKRMLLLK